MTIPWGRYLEVERALRYYILYINASCKLYTLVCSIYRLNRRLIRDGYRILTSVLGHGFWTVVLRAMVC